MNLVTALSTPVPQPVRKTRTTNGMGAYTGTGSQVLNLFGQMGALRGQGDQRIRDLFLSALAENQLLAVRAMFYNRDIRGGQGERQTFRVMLRTLAEFYPEIALQVLPYVPVYGRWDDLFVVFGTEVEPDALAFITEALNAGDKLCAKWMPRERKAKHEIADKIRQFIGLDWREYRSLLAGNTAVVETLMCKKDWGAINYSHVPSQAMSKYRTAFGRNDTARFTSFIAEAKAGNNPKVKINAGTLHPHQIVEKLGGYGMGLQKDVLEAQWAALPDFFENSGRRIFPVIDVSGSMSGGSPSPMDVAIALGLYIAERNTGPYQDAFITFDTNPRLLKATGSISKRVAQTRRAPWGGSTNLQATFNLLLDSAVRHGVAPDEMPEYILILSDMQFNAADRGFGTTAFQMIDRMYQKAGYERPNIVFWNLRAQGNVPVTVDDNGTAMVSGFSPSILKYIFTGAEAKPVTPLDTMLDVLLSERYAVVEIAE